MKFKAGRQAYALVLLCAMLLSLNASAQSYVRYVVPSDIGTKSLFADDVLSSIALPWGVSRVDNNPAMRDAAFELMEVIRDKDMRLLSVYVCGSASPDGLWQDNVRLSKARTEAAANYLHHVTGIPMGMIHQESLNEDWDRLAELIEESDIIHKDEILYIIRTKDWGERKGALQKLAGGKVWRILLDDYFPQLRCVRIGFYCLWEPSKPYLTCPLNEVVEIPEEPECEVVEEPVEEEVKPKKEVISRVDTVYVRDTIYYMKETVYIPQQTTTVYPKEPYAAYRPEYVRPERVRRERPVYETPWMMGFKTNIIGDLIAVPTLGAEIQLADRLSLDLQGFYTTYNIFNANDMNTNVYGFSPEIRFWPEGRTMRKGQFIGLHARCAWYTLEWKDGLLYQNGPKDMWEGNYHNAGNGTPAWSAGFTYGYSAGLGKKGHWGIEFLVGIGYANYRQNIASFNNGIWQLVEHQDKHHFGITRAGINLTYRFSVRKVNPDYYENN